MYGKSTTGYCFLTFLVLCTVVLIISGPCAIAQQRPLAQLKQTEPRFEKNAGQLLDVAGQARPDLLYTARCPGATIFLRKTGISYVFMEAPKALPAIPALHMPSTEMAASPAQAPSPRKGCRVDVEFLNCSNESEVVPTNRADAYTNYYLPGCPEGLTHIPGYGKVVYKNIWPHIDLEFYFTPKGLEYDVVMHPGADAADIKLQYRGIEQLQGTEDGRLKIEHALGTITESAPVVVKEDGSLLAGAVPFIIDAANNTIGFRAGTVQDKDLRIDPEVLWSTYFGGSGYDYLTNLGLDNDSGLYVTGATESADFPVTPGAFQSSHDNISDPGDVVIMKFTTSGKLEWATYYGGSKVDFAKQFGSLNNGPGIHFDAFGDIVVAGMTYSHNFPVTNGTFKTSFTSTMAAYIIKFKTDGTRKWATFFGGDAGQTGASSIVTDKLANIYITGMTTDSILHNSRNPYNANPKSQHIFVAKFNPYGQRIWSLIYGSPKVISQPSGWESAIDINIDANANLVIGGESNDRNFPVSPGAFRSKLPGASASVLLSLDSSGERRWATFLDGNSFIIDVCADKNGNVYACGLTTIATILKNAFQSKIAGQDDAFLVKFDTDGKLLVGTCFGTPGRDHAYGVVADDHENVVICGITSGTDLYMKDAIQPSYSGGPFDGFMARFNKTGNLMWSTYFGGSEMDNPTDVIMNEQGTQIYMCGLSLSTDLPLKNPDQAGSNGNYEGFITRILDCTPQSHITQTGSACSGDTVTLLADPGFKAYLWSNGDTTRWTRVTKSGNYSVLLTNNDGCQGSSENVLVNFSPRPVSPIQPSGTVTVCEGDSVELIATGVYPQYRWSNSDTTYNTYAKTSGTYIVTVSNTGGCSITDSVEVMVRKSARPGIQASNNHILCKGGQVTLTAADGYSNYTWSNGDTGRVIQVTQAGSYRVYADTLAGYCSGYSAWLTISPSQLDTMKIISTGYKLCSMDTVTLDAGPGFVSYEWNTGDTTQKIRIATTGTYIVTLTDTNGCTAQGRSTTITMHPGPGKPQITLFNNALISSRAFQYQWYKDDVELPGATQQQLSPLTPGRYYVIITDSLGCTAVSEIFIVEDDDTDPGNFQPDYFKVFPNPTQGELKAEGFFNSETEVSISLTDVLGRNLMTLDEPALMQGKYFRIIPMYTLAPAMYVLQVKLNGEVRTYKIIRTSE